MNIAPEKLWRQVLKRLQQQLSQPTFDTWIKPTQIQELDDNHAVIATPNPFARNWLQKHYINTIAEVIEDILGHPVEIKLVAAKGDNVYAGVKKDIAWSMPVTNGRK
ncbi:MAG: DnaA N-terminal domain-containing protein [Spirulinaceae cyanobacterium]